MGKQLVICEKPDQARTYAAVLGSPKRQNGYVEVGNFVFTWAIGHLFRLCDPGEVNEAWAGPWDIEKLPMLPDRISRKVGDSVKSQWAVVKKLLKSSDVSEVVNGCDAGREGELIFRECYEESGCKKPVKRLWVSDYTPEAVRKAFDSLKDGAAFQGLADAARSRAEADWLIGMNLSRLFTLKADEKISVGRVQIPTLGLLVQREQDITNFKARDFWRVTIEFQDKGFATWHKPTEFKETRIFSEDDARGVVIRSRKGDVGKVMSSEGKEGKTNAPLCYDLGSLQMDMNKRHGLTAEQTLKLAQALYEKHKLLTYPRTDCQFLSSELFADLHGHLDAIMDFLPEESQAARERMATEGLKGFRVVNDKRITDHHAIIPTKKAPILAELTEDERRVYETVSRRFCAAFMPPATFMNSVAWIEVGGERFKAEGKVFLDRGWINAEPWRIAIDKPMPALTEGQEVRIAKVQMPMDKTKPPKRFSEADLLKAMITAGKDVEDEDLSKIMRETKGLGTSATRAEIIETLIRRQYAERKAKALLPTAKGRAAFGLIFKLCPQVTNPVMTGEWEHALERMENGTLKRAVFASELHKFISGVVDVVKSSNEAYSGPRTAKKECLALGKCPICGGKVVSMPKSYSCENWNREGNKCPFTIWKLFRGQTLKESHAKALLTKGKIRNPMTFKAKESGKKYKAYVILQKDGSTGVEFANRR
ncbi:type IA DNA topoisomerase [Desulfovibrio ferrophilus]|uniref:DNA topoisomerase n=1 Tax=Desulfovibrio ferrophilus TaxID=241368 RepID=A0A2Z6B429_9BACT|nr:type IA DNA topoisomerase [Desulfovibrio ferrophilus]BBD10146.1 DNA topoisomerase [Desulfovibrio ferrophilus]